ncbi:MAG: exodeoxyribonuclease V subunit alpha [Planctomycetota bacterium]
MSEALLRLERRGVLQSIDRHLALALDAQVPGGAALEVLLAAALASRAVQNGHVCADLQRVTRTPLVDAEGAPVPDAPLPELSAWRDALRHSALVTVIGGGGPAGDGAEIEASPRPLVLVDDRLYLHRYWRYERRLLETLAARQSARPAIDEAVLREGLSRLFPADAANDGPDLQRRAAIVAVLRHLTVISGGPGTGKTSTVVRVLALLQEQALAHEAGALRMLLLAPTGKAAQRLAESIHAQRAGLPCVPEVLAAIPAHAATLHRALGYQPGRPTQFRHHRDRPLPADVVLVDEASMVDLALMAKLCDAVAPTARLILIGDKDQLASVEAGAILGDLCGETGGQTYSAAFAADVAERTDEALPVPTPDPGPSLLDGVVHLTRSYRYAAGSGIERLARAINRGDADEAIAVLEAGGDVRWVSVPPGADLAAALAPPVRHGFAGVADGSPTERLQLLQRFRLLCVHRQGERGVLAVGDLAEHCLGAAGVLDLDDEWFDGRPLLVTRNDHALELFNGDVGVIAPDPVSGERKAWFPTAAEPRALAPARLPPHETTFAMTVHKAQGSEFDAVALVLPERPSPILTRELVYTALTRARRSVTVYGTENVLRDAIRRRIDRASGLRAGT